MELVAYLEQLEGGVFKLLPLWEDQNNGQDVHLDLYIQDLLDEMIGAQETFPSLAGNGHYIKVVNTVQYMAKHECSRSAWKRRVFGMMNTLNRMRGYCRDV